MHYRYVFVRSCLAFGFVRLSGIGFALTDLLLLDEWIVYIMACYFQFRLI